MLKRLIEPLIERILARLFGPSAPDPARCEGWAVGDLAECLFEGPWRNTCGMHAVGPDLWQVLPVAAVHVAPHAWSGEEIAFLTFARFGAAKYEALCFRHAKASRSGLGPQAAAFFDDRRSRPLKAPLQSEMS